MKIYPKHKRYGYTNTDRVLDFIRYNSKVPTIRSIAKRLKLPRSEVKEIIENYYVNF